MFQDKSEEENTIIMKARLEEGTKQKSRPEAESHKLKRRYNVKKFPSVSVWVFDFRLFTFRLSLPSKGLNMS